MINADFYETRSIHRATVNGRKVKLFELWYLTPKNAWVFCGNHSAPVGARKEELVGLALEDSV